MELQAQKGRFLLALRPLGAPCKMGCVKVSIAHEGCNQMALVASAWNCTGAVQY